MSEISVEDFIKEKNQRNYRELFESFKYSLITAIYYALGLTVGASLYKNIQSDVFEKLTTVGSTEIQSLFLTNVLIYFSLFLIVLFLGFCLFGHHLINVIPAVIGITAGIRIAYYLINFGAKGIGYSLLMIAPYSALYITVLTLTVENSSMLSKALLEAAKNCDVTLVAKPYMKKYLVLGAGIIVASIINAVLIHLLNDIITI